MLRLLIPVILTPVLLLAGCQTPVEQAASYAQQAQALSEGGDQIGAIRAMQKALAVRDDNADYFLALSAIEMRAGDPGQAFVAAKRALELDGGNRTALTIVANVGLQVGQVDDADDAAGRLLSLDPSSLVGLQVKGLVALYRNKDADAEVNANRLLQLSPSDEAGTIIRARVMAKAQKYEEAIAFLDQTIAQGRTTPALLITKINLYRVLRRGEDMEKGYEALEKAVEQPTASLQLDHINLLYKLGQKAEARSLTAKFLSTAGADAKDLDLLERIWSEFDRVPFTRDTIKNARNWGDPVLLLGIGRYLLWRGEPQLADDLYFSFREGARPVGISIHQRALAGLGHVDDARKGVDIVLKRDPGDADSLLLRAMFAMEAGDRGLAVEGLQKAIDADPGNPETYVALAGVHARSGDKWRASQVFEDGLKQLPQNFLLIERYARFLHDSGNKSRAVSVSRAFARAVPSSVYAWTIMAQQCAWAGDAACATEAATGRQSAATLYQIDEPPGTPKDRGLLGKF